MEFYDIEIDSDEDIYKVSQNLVNVTSDFADEYIAEGAEFSATLTPATDMTIQTVVVMMGGVDVTSTAYDAGEVSISSVSGDIVITAVAAA
jgi:hypothetical protein